MDGRIGVRLDHNGHEIKVRASNLVPIGPLPDAFEAADTSEIRQSKTLELERQVYMGSLGADAEIGVAARRLLAVLASDRCAAARVAGRHE